MKNVLNEKAGYLVYVVIQVIMVGRLDFQGHHRLVENLG